VDPSLFILEKDGKILFLLDWVDDMLVASAHDDLIDYVSQSLCTEYKITDMGPAQKYVGLSILRDESKGEMWVHQSGYIKEMAEKYQVTGTAYPDTPLPYNFLLQHPGEGSEDEDSSETGPGLSKDQHKRYQKIVGALNYCAHTTRIDIAFAVNQLSRAMHYAKARHLAAAEHCVKYLLGTHNYALHYARSAGSVLECFVDASHGMDASKKSVTGFLLKFAGGPIRWASRKQDRITSSTCDSESQAVMTAVQYVEHARDLLEDLYRMQCHPTPVFNDNTATIGLCIDNKAHKKSVQLTKPMALVRQRTKYGVIAPIYVRTTDQAADFLTKRLDFKLFSKCRDLCGLVPLPS
jgi:hypothetical protein